MNRYDFLRDAEGYIDSLREGAKEITRDEMREWIKKEGIDFDRILADDEIEWILNELYEEESK